ncbi:MAG: tetratricopeptide repeat protein [Acidobacteriota bacterium]
MIRKGQASGPRRWRPVTLVFLFVVLVCASARPLTQSVTHPDGLGSISFPTSGSAPAQREFLRGVAALHNFEYEEANEAFVKAQQLDLAFAMAYWGEAMTYHQTLWRHEDLVAGRRVLARLAPTPPARSAKAGTDREKAFLAAVDVLFGEGDETTRRAAYARALEKMHANMPGDPEVAVFYALALLGTMSRGLIGAAEAHEGHSAGLAGSDVQVRVREILGRVLQSHANHPGALHYLLHNEDDPAHARLGLAAARAYATVAPQSSHALHMPAHIFLQLGMWREAADSDRAAYDASVAWVQRKGHPPALRSFHALSWLQYELLQLGRYREAWGIVNEMIPIVKASGQPTIVSDFASMRARFVLESRRWDVLAQERDFGNVNELFAIGASAARMKSASLAQLARQGLAARAESPQEGDLRPAIAIMEREVAALMALAEGRHELAVEILRAATASEMSLPPPLGLPNPVKPAPELLGEVLLEAGRPREALEPFTQALGRNANRTLSVLGLARAYAALGDTAAAKEHYEQVLNNFAGADSDRPELAEARNALQGSESSVAGGTAHARGTPIVIGVVLGTAGILVLAFFAQRRAARRTAKADRGPRPQERLAAKRRR